MAIVEIRSELSHRSLMNKSKSDLALMVLDLVRRIPQSEEHGGRAVILNGMIAICVGLDALPVIVEAAWATNNLSPRMKITNVIDFANDLVQRLNDESEDGSTAIHRMFDKAIQDAVDQGASGIEPHGVQEF